MSVELITTDDFELTQRISRSLVASAFFQISGKDEQAVAQAVVKVMAGRELGIQPVAAMMGVNVIQGRVALSAQLMLACAKRAGYRWEKHEADGWCSLEWRDRDGEFLGSSKFSMDDARNAGLVKPGGNWTKYPKQMLFWRAAAIGVREFCPDAVAGMAVYTADELGVEVDPESSNESGVHGSKQEQAEVLRAKLIDAGKSEDEAQAEAEKFAAPKAKKRAKPKPFEIDDDDLPPALRAEPTEAELDAQFAKQERV